MSDEAGVDAAGAARITMVTPSSVPLGAHRVAVYAADGTLLGWQSVTVALGAWGITSGNFRNRLLKLQQFTVYVEGIKGFPNSEVRKQRGGLGKRWARRLRPPLAYGGNRV